MNFISEIFGCNVFNDDIMREKLPKEIYKALKQTVKAGKPLDRPVADAVASAMKDWAVSKGATHYTHWFQPMTGITAEKHDSFISPINEGSSVIMEFSGKELIKGESDASSFPSGGLRATFEARGYTAWDPTSYAFIKDNTLCIPTAFCSYGGEALDKKTPLLRSMEALGVQALRVLKLFGNEGVTSVTPTIGPEQEYFLVDKAYYDERKDLIYTGRTLFGAMPPKGQELDDHYYGVIKPRIAAYMHDLDEELWKLGILAKTEHNEVAPAQHELAPVYSTVNIATDHNQLTMEIMKKVALKHGMVCLLNEKPFAGVNGSGKHNNWSLVTDTGINLFEPGKTPSENAQFLLLLCAVIEAVDTYAELLRVSVASAGNDHRLGANEAPPAIISVFLGDELTDILSAIEKHSIYEKKASVRMEIGAHVLPTFRRDTTDRNRTSPFAFTGNKFEFRMPGSSMSVSGPNIVINTAVAEVLKNYADELENADDLNSALNSLIARSYKAHKRVVFNGNNYSAEWLAEAKKRGLPNLRSTPAALPHYCDEKNLALFAANNVFTESEVHSRMEIKLENYNKTIRIEARTMSEMVQKSLLNAAMRYQKTLCDEALAKKSLNLPVDVEEALVSHLSALCSDLYRALNELNDETAYVTGLSDTLEVAKASCNRLLPAMDKLRGIADMLEGLIPDELLPYPTYGKLLYGI